MGQDVQAVLDDGPLCGLPGLHGQLHVEHNRPIHPSLMPTGVQGTMNHYLSKTDIFQPQACLSNLLTPTSSLSLLLFTTTSPRPSAGSDLKFLERLDVKVEEELERTVNIKFPKSVTKNGSLYLSVFALPALGEVRMSGNGWWQNAISHPHASYSLTPLTQYAVPEAETFNLLGDQKEGDKSEGKEKKKVDRSNAVTHLRSRILLSTMTEQVTMEPRQVPGEIAHTMQLTKDRKSYLPILYIDELSMRQRELVKVNATDEAGEVKVVYRPISFGKLRLFLQFSSALTSMQGMGFTEKDTDEVP